METQDPKKSKTQKYPLKINWFFHVRLLAYVLIAGGITWFMYGTPKSMPEPYCTEVFKSSQEYYDKSGSEGRYYDLNMGIPNAIRMVNKGEKVTVLAFPQSGSDVWVEMENGDRGMLFYGMLTGHQQIVNDKKFVKRRVHLDNYINIGKQQMYDKYLGRSFADNESNYWPALYCCNRGDTLYATYQMRMWVGTNPVIPTVKYVNDTAVSILSYSSAPYEGNTEWLAATPWAAWMYAQPYFHWPWDRPIIPRMENIIHRGWLIFTVPANFILFIIGLIIDVFWYAIVCGMLAIVLLLLYPFHLIFRKWSNGGVGLFLCLVILLTTYFYMPMFMIGHGSFMTVCAMIIIALCSIVLFVPRVRHRCEHCLNVGFIVLDAKTHSHTEYEKELRTQQGEEVRRDTHITKDIEKLLDENDNVIDERVTSTRRKVYITYRYYEYEVTIEKKYFDHHCSCTVCNSYIFRKDEEVQSKEVDKQLKRTFLKTKRSFIESL